MTKLTVTDAAAYLNVSKEAIHNRIRRGSLKSSIENGVKFVVISEEKSSTSAQVPANDRYTQHIESENIRLRDKVETLEAETIRLRNQREEMLIAQRISVEEIYKERDAQLRNILNVVATKFLSHVNPDSIIQEAINEESYQKEAQAINADIIPNTPMDEEWISLKNFLKLKRYGDTMRKNIKRRFKASAHEGNERFIIRDEKIYLNPSLYDYSNLLAGR